MTPTILIADDDAGLVEGLRWYLEDAGFTVWTVENGAAALDAFRALQPDIVILDIMMPGLDGVQVCEAIRGESNAFILMLSARDGESDKVRALGKGADDYVTKPFYATELVARLNGLLRRDPLHRRHGVDVQADDRQVTVNGEPVSLSSLEFDLLMNMMHHSQTERSHDVPAAAQTAYPAQP
jgi:two-component system response regulator MtrA